ncbi:hypothetical protein PPYR_06439 [Photinus pyralis]|uniref:Rhodanese domain-containing protein n=2 Tax=Photinus pyralis TaxID=7054 RepID=A0A1Y1KF10_PHOPY|nr:rhodanese domain-containing protein CG4456-like isoform X1 [Photinus pyralis]KAB0800700.1 hypothetical protein PPYR_06439 [Photinus pyralis]
MLSQLRMSSLTSFRLNYGLFKKVRQLQVITRTKVHAIQKEQTRSILLHSNKEFFPSKFLGLQKMCTHMTIKPVDFNTVRSLKDNRSTLLVDVREPEELKETGVLPASINIPLGEVENALKSMENNEFRTKYGHNKPALETPLVFSCRSGKRSETAAKTAISLGYKNVSNYTGGWLDWEENIKKN